MLIDRVYIHKRVANVITYLCYYCQFWGEFPTKFINDQATSGNMHVSCFRNMRSFWPKSMTFFYNLQQFEFNWIEIVDFLFDYKFASCKFLFIKICLQWFPSIYQCLASAFYAGFDRNLCSNIFFPIAIKLLSFFQHDSNLDAICEKIFLENYLFNIFPKELLMEWRQYGRK